MAARSRPVGARSLAASGAAGSAAAALMSRSKPNSQPTALIIKARGSTAPAPAIAVPRLLEVGEAREGVMEALDQHLLGRDHVVDLAAGLLRGFRVLVEGGVPAGM